ncbi:hypothetical protein AB6A40_005533 [Gnathostoma spinigerum]|uniref:G-protein coupled receptors family 1 profile domain-containing protein n=1 Tax=Gnathostoma spinigerum TaxID=75299 RepID=A0ABD6EFP7_9BILA
MITTTVHSAAVVAAAAASITTVDRSLSTSQDTVSSTYDATSVICVILICLITCSMILATLIGNALVILAVMLVRKLKQPCNYLLISLAVADFSVGFIVMPLALVELFTGKWVLGVVFCRIWTSSDQTLCTASIINLCMINVDRYLAVSRPLRYAAQRTKKRIFCYVVIVWIVAFIVSISPLVVWPAPPVENICQVNQNAVYQIYATIISFYLPTLIMVILFIKMWRAAKRLADQDRLAKKSVIGVETHTSNRRSAHRPSTILQKIPLVHNGKVQEKGEGKARKTLGVIMSIYIICWLPFFILALLKPQGVMPPRWLDHVILWLGYSNSLMNPLIYCKYNREFRVPFREMLCCRFSTLQTVMRKESFTSRFGPSRTQEYPFPAKNIGALQIVDTL